MTLQPIIPFEPLRTDHVEHGSDWIAQVKWDGVRMLVYHDQANTQIFNRHQHERTLQYPELTYVQSYTKSTSFIVDGEVIALEQGKPSFQTVMKRDMAKKEQKIAQLVSKLPILYMIFDILYLDGAWVTSLPLVERSRLLRENFNETATVKLVPSYPDPQQLWHAVQQQDLEGIVIKDLTSSYPIGGKDGRWLKLKKQHDLNAVVGGVAIRNGQVHSLLLGLHDQQGNLHYIGHAGTGKFPKDTWRTLTEWLPKLQQAENPFVNVVERTNTAVWIKPSLTVKVHFLEWTKGKTLRQPIIQSFVSVPPEQCVFY